MSSERDQRRQQKREQQAEELRQCVRLSRRIAVEELKGMEHSWALYAVTMGLVLGELLKGEA